jgi:hypothetical protein
MLSLSAVSTSRGTYLVENMDGGDGQRQARTMKIESTAKNSIHSLDIAEHRYCYGPLAQDTGPTICLELQLHG